MNIKIYVLSLLDSAERRQAIGQQLLGKGLDFTFVDAVDFRNRSLDSLEHLYQIHSQSSLKRMITSGEIGCALSHIKIYQEFNQANYDYALILEDDAILDRLDILEVELYCEVLNEEYDAILLGYSKLSQQKEKRYYLQYPIKEKFFFKKHNLGKAWKNSASGAVGYLIGKRGIEKILKNYSVHNKIQTVADDWLYFDEVCGLRVLHARPVVVFEDYMNLTSSLEKNRSIFEYSSESFLKNMAKYFRGFFRRIVFKFKN